MEKYDEFIDRFNTMLEQTGDKKYSISIVNPRDGLVFIDSEGYIWIRDDYDKRHVRTNFNSEQVHLELDNMGVSVTKITDEQQESLWFDWLGIAYFEEGQYVDSAYDYYLENEEALDALIKLSLEQKLKQQAMLPREKDKVVDFMSAKNKRDLDAGIISVDELSEEELDGIEKLYINEYLDLQEDIMRVEADIERLKAENERLRRELAESKKV